MQEDSAALERPGRPSPGSQRPPSSELDHGELWLMETDSPGGWDVETLTDGITELRVHVSRKGKTDAVSDDEASCGVCAEQELFKPIP